MLERVQSLEARAPEQDGPVENETAVMSSLKGDNSSQRMEEDDAIRVALGWLRR